MVEGGGAGEHSQEICNLHKSLFDRGFEKVLLSSRFSEVTLPNFLYNEENLLRLTVNFSGGKLRGLRTIRRNGQGVLNVTDYGSRLTFHIEGGPFDAHYNAGLQMSLRDTTLDLKISVPLIQLSFTLQEISPNQLYLEAHNMRMARHHLEFEETGDVRVSRVFYDMVLEELRPFIEVKVGQMLAQTLHNLAVEDFRAVKAYAAISSSHTTRNGGSAATSDWTNALGRGDSYPTPTSDNHSSDTSIGRTYGGGRALQMTPRRQLSPIRAGEPRRLDIFERCLKTLVLSAGIDPAQLLSALEAFSFLKGSVVILDGNMTGLSSIRRRGDTVVTQGGCGLRARMNLVFENLTISATASSSGFLWGFDIRAPEVETLLEIKENNAELEITAYKMNFTAPVKVAAKLPSAVRTVVNLFGGLPEMTLGAEELRQLEDIFLKYVQGILYTLQESMTGPPLPPSP